MKGKQTVLGMVLLLACMQLFYHPVSAQVRFLFNPMTNGRDLKGLSAVQILNNSNVSFIGNLIIEVKQTNPDVLVVKTAIPDVAIQPGSNLLQPGRLNTGGAVFGSNNEGNYARQTGNMPEAELEYCFRFVVTSKENNGLEFENCFTGNNLVGTPMELLKPDQQDHFCNKRPTFQWQPSMPVDPNTLYTLKLVEIQPKQKGAEAMLNNVPVVYQTNIKGYTQLFPSGSPELKLDQKYAWQITASTGYRQSLSEIWEFTVECEKDVVTAGGGYRELKSEDDGSYLMTGSQLRFAVRNDYVESKLQYQIKDLDNPSRKFRQLPELTLQKGINNILVDLNKIPGLKDDTEYVLQVTLPGGNQVSVRFKYDTQFE